MTGWNDEHDDADDAAERGGKHRLLRELLGGYALGHLDDTEQARVRAHLDGCTSCRAELAEIAPLAGLLEAADLDRFDLPALPAPDLGATIRALVADERRERVADEMQGRREWQRRRAARRTAWGAVAAALVLAALVGGAVLGRSTSPEAAGPAVTPTPTPTVTVEPIDLVVEAPRITIASSGLVAHTWGVELRMSGRGFARGEVFDAAFRDSATGALEPAGAFIGTGRDPMTCFLQSALLRADASEVVISDASGAVVLDAAL